MKYEDIIKQAYRSLGKEARDGQIKVINDVLLQYFDYNKHFVVLDAPTGTGKSIIGAVVAECVGMLRPTKALNSILLSSTNILLDQYAATFPVDPRFMVMKGADNYLCALKSNGPLKIKADTCIKRTKFFAKEDKATAKSICGSCAFLISRMAKNNRRNIITNYAYYFLDRLFIAPEDQDRVAAGGVPVSFEKRNIVVWDEAQLINDSFVNHCVIYFSKERADDYLKECERYFPESTNKWIEKLAGPLALIAKGAITIENLADTLRVLGNFYCEMRDGFMYLAETAHDYKAFTAYSKLQDKYKGLFCKINNYFTYAFEVVIDHGDKNDEMKVSPIFVSTMFKALVNSEFNLFMSGTVSQEFLTETLNLDVNDTGFVRASNQFNVSDKRIVASRKMMKQLNYSVLKEDSTFQELGNTTSRIINEYHAGQNGLIFAPSFAFVKKIASSIVLPDHQLVLHEKGALVDQLKEFKRVGDKPKVLISPSIYEGIDCPGDESRFQIFSKAPYFSLADKRMAHILKFYPEIYQILTVMRVVQGMGRSTRSVGDHCITYFLDSNLLSLFNSYHNIWQDQFLVSTSL